MERPKDFQRLRAIFEEDGAEVRRQLILSGLLLMIFERFKKYAIDQVDGFFSDHTEIKNGGLSYVRGEEFKKLIKDKGLGEPGQHTNTAFRAALHWFLELKAITADELELVERLYSLRNEIGHELLRILADDAKAPIALADTLMIFAVYVKIVRWWVKEIDSTIDPDFDQERHENTDWDATETTDTIFLREIIHKALAGDAEWEAVREMSRNTATSPD
jgi:hypothetical protein